MPPQQQPRDRVGGGRVGLRDLCARDRAAVLRRPAGAGAMLAGLAALRVGQRGVGTLERPAVLAVGGAAAVHLRAGRVELLDQLRARRDADRRGDVRRRRRTRREPRRLEPEQRDSNERGLVHARTLPQGQRGHRSHCCRRPAPVDPRYRPLPGCCSRAQLVAAGARPRSVGTGSPARASAHVASQRELVAVIAQSASTAQARAEYDRAWTSVTHRACRSRHCCGRRLAGAAAGVARVGQLLPGRAALRTGLDVADGRRCRRDDVVRSIGDARDSSRTRRRPCAPGWNRSRPGTRGCRRWASRARGRPGTRARGRA